MVRRSPAAGADEIEWQPDPAAATGPSIDAASLEGVPAVVHLAGAGIGDRRWTTAYKRRLLTSRTGPTALLAATLAGLDRPPSTLLSGSAIGFYGDRGDEILDERSEPGVGFLPDLARDWEAATGPASQAGIRTAHLRTGIVLAEHGGALKKMLPLFRMGMGGRFGSGHQYQSWITLADVVGAIVHLLDADVAGPVNLTAPNPVTNRIFTEALGRTLARPTPLPIPSLGPKLLLGADMAQALLFDSQRILPKVLTRSGYTFGSAELDAGLRTALGQPSTVTEG